MLNTEALVHNIFSSVDRLDRHDYVNYFVLIFLLLLSTVKVFTLYSYSWLGKQFKKKGQKNGKRHAENGGPPTLPNSVMNLSVVRGGRKACLNNFIICTK